MKLKKDSKMSLHTMFPLGKRDLSIFWLKQISRLQNGKHVRISPMAQFISMEIERKTFSMLSMEKIVMMGHSRIYDAEKRNTALFVINKKSEALIGGQINYSRSRLCHVFLFHIII